MSPKLILPALILLVLAALVLRLRRGGADRDRSPEGGKELGNFETYGAKIRELAADDDLDYFFVTCMATSSDRFVQMSASRDGSGPWSYRLSFPLVDWSKPFEAPFRALAAREGLSIDDSNSEYLDIDFASAPAHFAFARSVMTEVLGHPADDSFEITWG